MKTGFLGSTRPVTVLELTEQEKRVLSDIEAQKQSVINDLNNKIVTLKKDIKDVESIFFEDYRGRIESYNDKVNKLIEAEADFDEKTRGMEKERKELDVLIDKFHREKTSTLANINTKIMENKSILSQISRDRKIIADKIQENEGVLARIKAANDDFILSKKKAEDIQKAADKITSAAMSKDDDANRKMAEAESRIRLAEEREKSNTDQAFNLRNEQKSLRILIDEEARQAKDLKEIILQQLKIKEKNEDELNTLNAEKENNIRIAVALKAREIAVAERERLTNEREKNVKILENKLID